MNEQLDRMELKLAELTGKVDQLYESNEKMRKYAKWTAIVTIGVIVIPLLIIPFVLPSFFSAEGLNNLNTSSLQGLQ